MKDLKISCRGFTQINADLEELWAKLEPADSPKTA